jgi:heme-degrading monooxygenase HmoA
MAEMVTTGVWIVSEPNQAAFLEAWGDFAGWASAMDGAAMLRLGRDTGQRNRFVSFGPWDSPEHVHAWKASGEFRQRMASVMQHVDEFHPAELDVVASASRGKATREPTTR